MKRFDFEGVNLAELLPRIPDTVRNGLPFGLVKLDLTGKILEYNMAEGDLTGVDPAWAMGKNFFDDVALCTKTQAFYGQFVEGVKRGFMNTVFDFTFDHQEIATQVKVHMFTMPDSSGKKTVMLLVKRSDKPLIVDAISNAPRSAPAAQPVFQNTSASHVVTGSNPTPTAVPEIQDIVNAVILAMNQGVNQGVGQSAIQGGNQQPTAAPQLAASDQQKPPPEAPMGKSRHQDILKF